MLHFSKWKRQCWERWCSGISDIQIFNWIQILPLNGSCFLSVFSASFLFEIVVGCIIPQLHGERGWEYFTATLEESLFQSHCSYIRPSDEQQNNALIYLSKRKVVGIQADIILSKMVYWEFLYAKLEKNLARQKIKLSPCCQNRG